MTCVTVSLLESLKRWPGHFFQRPRSCCQSRQSMCLGKNGDMSRCQGVGRSIALGNSEEATVSLQHLPCPDLDGTVSNFERHLCWLIAQTQFYSFVQKSRQIFVWVGSCKVFWSLFAHLVSLVLHHSLPCICPLHPKVIIIFHHLFSHSLWCFPCYAQPKDSRWDKVPWTPSWPWLPICVLVIVEIRWREDDRETIKRSTKRSDSDDE